MSASNEMSSAMPEEEERTNEASKAAKAEALEAPVVFEYDGETYTIDAASKSLDYYEAAEEGKGIGMARALLGRSQWFNFKQKYPGPEGVDAMLGFLEAYGKAVGSGNR